MTREAMWRGTTFPLANRNMYEVGYMSLKPRKTPSSDFGVCWVCIDRDEAKDVRLSLPMRTMAVVPNFNTMGIWGLECIVKMWAVEGKLLEFGTMFIMCAACCLAYIIYFAGRS